MLSTYTPRNLVHLTNGNCHPFTLTLKSSFSSQKFIATVFPMFSEGLLAWNHDCNKFKSVYIIYFRYHLVLLLLKMVVSSAKRITLLCRGNR